MFNFDYSYLSLPEKFYSITKPNVNSCAKVFLLNNQICNKFKLKINKEEELIKLLFSNKKYRKSYAQAYAGHQFGYFTKLGDGRAIILGEHITKDNKRFDIQIKGAGRTQYSRNGDGKATFGSMLKEYLMSEAMHYLNISSSRSLAVIKTGENIYRTSKEEGSILVRIMKSHIRVGTFEYASYFGSSEDLKKITTYSINRLFPEISKSDNHSLTLLELVMQKQIDLVVDWMRVGFIHGVINTDNTSISGESFDYGPCAFMNTYDPETVYSSIDYNGRYAFGNQPKIIKWNILRFAEALLPIIHKNKEKSIQLAQSVINKFDAIWKKKYYGMMLKKIGFKNNHTGLYTLIDELLNLMKKLKLDYTNTFYLLSQNNFNKSQISSNSDFIKWEKKWQDSIKKTNCMKEAKHLMNKYNPVFIPRNYIVDEAIKKAVNGDMTSINKLLEILSNPYQYQDDLKGFMKPPTANFEECFQTYCGT
ncbi:MAG: hypothetical protein CMD02_04680 [Flavobacteriales bacterium]|nr:hypothetical protein [Flavobacteriales bacterium]